MEKTTVQIGADTLERLKMIKAHPKQSYDETINFLIDDFEEEELTINEIKDIQEALEEVKKGEVYPIEQVAKELGISLKCTQ